MNTKQLGRHILVEFYDCDKAILNDHDKIEKHMNKAAKRANATVVESAFHFFNPWGVSGAVVISESHLTIHTWPEFGYAAVDLFTCGDEVNPWVAFKYLEEKLMAKKIETKEIPRGVVKKINKYCNVESEKIKYKPDIVK
ncbi:MAG: S-adenosylmethionine decarboxylase proenzyme [Firmicutes bacterium]|nr:S-adenosylmethionine decarboxylase proenzyme [Bacillota bacterium]